MDKMFPEAKALFMKNDGDTFHMAREGEHEAYKAFCVPRVVEVRWIKELRVMLLDELATMQLGPVHASRIIQRYLATVSHYTKDPATIDTLLQAVTPRLKEFDSFFRLRFAEGIVYACNSLGTRTDTTLRGARRFAERLLQDVMDNPVTVAEEWKQVPHLEDTFEETAIKQRALKAYAKATSST